MLATVFSENIAQCTRGIICGGVKIGIHFLDNMYWYILAHLYLFNNATNSTTVGYDNTVTTVGTNSWAGGFQSTVSNTDALALGYKNRTSGARATTIGNSNTASGTNSFAAGNSSQATAESALAIGDTAVASATNSVAIGSKASATVAGGVALGQNSVASIDSGVTGYLANGDTSSTWQSTVAAVSVGNVANNVTRQITSVAAGTEDTDAVNVAQLKAGRTFTEAGRNITVTNATNSDKSTTYTVALADDINLNSVTANTVNVGPVKINSTGLNAGNTKITGVVAGEISSTSTDAVNGSQLYATDQKINNVVNKIDGFRSEISETGAMSAALAGLKPMQYDPMERHQFMTALGYYRDKQAIAMGLATYPRENTLLHAGIAYGGTKYMMNAGATFKFGRSEYAKNRPAQYGDGPISSIYVLQDENTILKAKVAEQDQVISSQSARLDSQEARIAQLEALVQNLVK